MNKKYDWLASECALERYPVELLKGEFQNKKGRYVLYIPDGCFVCNGMGDGFSTHAVGADTKPLPAKLYIHWFSFVENKFYEGTFDLPADKIKKLFREGLKDPSTGEKIDYSMITIGLAPEGEVSVFLQAKRSSLIVARFTAEEVQTEWKQFIDNSRSREDYISRVVNRRGGEGQLESMQQELAGGNVWHTYTKRYPWVPEMIGRPPVRLWVKMLDGERENFNFSEYAWDRTNRSIPSELFVVWVGSNNKEYLADVYVDEEHSISAFKNAAEKYPDEQMILSVKVIEKPRTVERSTILRTVELYLNVGDDQIRLKTKPVKAFKAANQ